MVCDPGGRGKGVSPYMCCTGCATVKVLYQQNTLMHRDGMWNFFSQLSTVDNGELQYLSIHIHMLNT